VSAEFVPLAHLLRPPPADAPSRAAVCNALDGYSSEGPIGEGAQTGASDATEADGPDDDVAVALREARLFRARLLDAFDDAAARLLRELASAVLARELRSAPCDLAGIIAQVRERTPVVRARVAPGDVARVTGVPVVADGTLAPGDAIVELDGGAVDARLGVRLAVLLEAFA
jgi:flagellar biosynthesis/type III secretory pathway protein FliH